MVPKATPPQIVATLNGAVNTALTETEFVGRLQALGVAPIPKDPAATAKFLHADAAKWAELIRVARISIENS
jgi:tripartite-type tricarboxylate transporter receptor subunit TctC